MRSSVRQGASKECGEMNIEAVFHREPRCAEIEDL